MIHIGANLAHDSFDADRDAVLARAWDAGLEAIVITGSTVDSARRALKLAATAPGRLFSTAGVHPHHASDWSDDARVALHDLTAEPACVSLGECGLDYFRDFSPRDAQRSAFADQLRLAADTSLPAFLHQRDAHADFLSMLREHRGGLGAVVVHCFSDTPAALEDYLALDCHIGITGWICDERRGLELREAVRLIPANRLLVETDAPYLLPRTIAPRPDTRRNEPMYLPWVVATAAAARGEDPADLQCQTAANARAFFRLPAAES